MNYPKKPTYKNHFKQKPWYIEKLRGFSPGGAARFTQTKPKKR